MLIVLNECFFFESNHAFERMYVYTQEDWIIKVVIPGEDLPGTVSLAAEDVPRRANRPTSKPSCPSQFA